MTSRGNPGREHLKFAGDEPIRRGSTLKPLVPMELLGSCKLDRQQRLVCRRPLRIGGMCLDCGTGQKCLELDADDDIACNSYVAQVALPRTGEERAEALRRAGLDSLTGLVQSESTAHIERATNQRQPELMALGARGIEVTPLELPGLTENSP